MEVESSRWYRRSHAPVRYACWAGLAVAVKQSCRTSSLMTTQLRPVLLAAISLQFWRPRIVEKMSFFGCWVEGGALQSRVPATRAFLMFCHCALKLQLSDFALHY